MILLYSALVKPFHEVYKNEIHKGKYKLRRETGIKAGQEIIEESSENPGLLTLEET